MPRGGVPTAEQALQARVYLNLIIIDLETALCTEDEDRYQDNSIVRVG